MPIFYPDILEQVGPARKFSYNDKEVMLYALSIGLGADPLHEQHLRFVYERGLKVVPSIVTVLGTEANALRAPPPAGKRATELNYTKVLHGEHKVEIFRPLPSAGTFTARSRVVGAYDKGSKGAVVILRNVWSDEAGEEVAASTSSIFARGDGGFGGPSEGAPEPHSTPKREPDLSLDLPTRPDQALLYRLNGDRNPLHADPEVARSAGFDRPVLHGLCSYGMTCRAMLETVADYNPDAIRSHQVRFSSPAFAGDVITVDMWREGKDVSFEARVKERNVTIIKNGLTVLR